MAPYYHSIGDFLLNILAEKGPNLENYANDMIVEVICRITNIAWFDNSPEIREIVSQAEQFLQVSFMLLYLRMH
jgi:exportin-7